MRTKPAPLAVYELLLKAYGPQNWWPAETPFEVVLGAILTQNTAWQNVEKAINNIKHSQTIDPFSISKIKNDKLERLIRPSGYFREKVKKLKAFCKHLIDKYGGNLERMFDKGKEELREELLSLHGIGEETADSIILYAAGKRSFVVDAYTRRIGQRLGWFKEDNYGKIKIFFEKNLPRSVKVYNEFHALLVEQAKKYCKTKPDCAGCILKAGCAHANLYKAE